MKLLFVHGSEAIKKDTEGNLYADGSYSNEIWERYYCLTNDLTVLTRHEKKEYSIDEAKKRFHLLDNKRYKFVDYKNDDSIMEFELKSADLVIARVPSSVSYKAIDYAIKYNKKFLLEIVGCPFDIYWNNKGFNNKKKAIEDYFKLRKYARKAPYVLYVTDKFLQKRYPTNGKSLGCSDASLEDINENTLKERIDKINKLNGKSTIKLCSVGTIDLKIKGQQYVIKALKKLNKCGEVKYYYDIVGGGNKDSLEILAKKLNVEKYVNFLGMKTHNEVFEIMKNADIYIQPSETEGLARVLVEAINVAVPCIASNVGGNSEVVCDKKFLFKSKNVNSLIKAIKKMTNEEMINQAKQNFEHSKKYDKTILNRDRHNFYQDFAK